METCKKTVPGSVDRAIPVDSPEAAITEEADETFYVKSKAVKNQLGEAAESLHGYALF
jgi:hypothetical protein